MVIVAGNAQFGGVCVVADVAPVCHGPGVCRLCGVYVSTALMWLWLVDAVKPSPTDWVGVMVVLLGVAIILVGASTK